MKLNFFIPKYAIMYIIMSFSFSTLGLLFPTGMRLQNPLHSISVEEVSGHFLWGLAAGALTLNPTYILLGGLFACFIDADHLIYFFHVDALGRMSHSILFGVVSIIVLIVLRRRDYMLASLGFVSVLSHISYDIFANESAGVPFLIPFYNEKITFVTFDWIYFEIAAVVIVGFVTFIIKRNEVKKVAT